MALRHVARAGAVASTATRLAPAALATSSRVGLDFNLPRRAFSSTPARFYEPKTKELPLRWSPLPPERYNGDGWGGKVRAPTHLLTVLSTYNNTLLTFSDADGPLFGTVSGGSDKVFKRGKRAEFEAAHQAALKMFVKITAAEEQFRARGKDQVMSICIVYKGWNGNGREAVHSAIAGGDGAAFRPLISRLEDHTPIRVGGTRAPGRRRL